MRMRPSADPRTPGIYQSQESAPPPALSIADTRITGFVGLSQKGPLGEPIQISNWDEFLEIFGEADVSYLADSVYGFFRNGGTTAWVCRVAHAAAAGTTPDLSHAASAYLAQHDHWNKPTLTIRALNEGSWGNQIWIRCQHQIGAQALLTRDLEVGAGEAHVSTTRGFEVGALIRIFDREHSDYAVITEVSDKLIKWSSETPISRKHRAAAPTHLEVLEFELHVALRDRREVFKGLQLDARSRNYAPRVIAARSRLIRAFDMHSTSPVPHNRPEPLALTKLLGGRDGLDAVTPEDFIGHDNGPADRWGLMALAARDEVALLACPDAMTFYERDPGPTGELRCQRVQDQMISICELQKERFAILDIPMSKDIDWVRRWRRRTDSSFAAYYWPWLKTTGPSGQARDLPPSGFMAGVYATRDAEGVHFAPANMPIIGVDDLSLRLTEDHMGLLNSESVNTFRLQRGVRPWGARTASNDPEWRYINVRRLFIMLRRSIDAGFSWITFEPNDADTWGLVRDRTTAFLAGLYQNGMLAGGNPGQAFFVKCDAENNSADQVDLGILTCEIGVAPVHPAEFITISLTQQMNSGTGDAG